MGSLYLKVLSCLNRSELTLIVVLGFLAIISALCEFISIAIIFPFISLLSGNYAASPAMAGIWPLGALHFSGEISALQVTALTTLAFLFSGVVRIIYLRICAQFTTKIGLTLSEKIFYRILHDEYRTHLDRNSSDVVSVLSVKFKTVTNDVLFSTVLLFGNLFILFFFSFIILLISPIVAIAVFGGILLIYGSISSLMKKRIFSNSEKISNEENKAIKIVQESIGGIRDIILLNNFRYFVGLFRAAEYEVLNAQSNNHFIANAPRYAIEAIGFSTLALSAYLYVEKYGANEIIPLFGVIAIAAQRLIPLAQQCFWSVSHIRGAKKSFEEVVSYLPESKPKAGSISNYEGSMGGVTFNSEIFLNKISFTYNLDREPAITEVTLRIKKGDRVGISGKSGAGKSTLVDILMGLLFSTHGHLEVDGIQINSENRTSWQKMIAHVPQKIYLSDTTLLENIAFGIPREEIDVDKAIRSAMRADLGILLESLPSGIFSRVGEDGGWLSGGQKQRVGIARALYRDAELIIFDEATSSLDAETEKNIIESISRIQKNITLVIIAHRPSSLKICSKILYLEDCGASIINYEDFICKIN